MNGPTIACSRRPPAGAADADVNRYPDIELISPSVQSVSTEIMLKRIIRVT